MDRSTRSYLESAETKQQMRDYVKYVILMSLFAPGIKHNMAKISEILTDPIPVVREYSHMIVANLKDIYRQSHPDAKFDNFENLDVTDLELNGDDCQKVGDNVREDVIRIIQKQNAGQQIVIPEVPLPRLRPVNASEFMQGCLHERNRNIFIKKLRLYKYKITDRIGTAIAKVWMRI